jgi:hypothetical protein
MKGIKDKGVADLISQQVSVTKSLADLVAS